MKARQFITLFTLMVAFALLNVAFYIHINRRNSFIPGLRMLLSSNTGDKLDISKNEKIHGMYGNDPQKRKKQFNSTVNIKSKSLEHTFNGTGEYRKRLPGCLVIGVKKGGTDAVRRFMNVHPKIVCHLAECKFFNHDENFNRGVEYYRNQMPYSYPDQITVEKTPAYFHTEIAVKRIHAFNKNIKAILTLRHPIKRLLSDYRHEKRYKHEPEISKRFEDVVINETGHVNLNYRPVIKSVYYKHVKLWLKYFPLKQTHIVDGDNFLKNPVEEIGKIETFLGLSHEVTKDKVYFNQTRGFFCYIDGEKHECLQENKGHFYDTISPGVYNKLFDFYKGYNEKLFALLGRTFKWNSEY